MTFNNLIHERLYGLGNQLLNTLESAGTIPHPTTVGDIREAAICDSICRFLPLGLDACSGFVTDTRGTITPQLDIILFRREALAPFLLEGRSALVPFETFGAAIEVKSTLQKKHFEQIKTQIDALRKMIYTAFIPSIGGTPAATAFLPPFTLPLIHIVSYEVLRRFLWIWSSRTDCSPPSRLKVRLMLFQINRLLMSVPLKITFMRRLAPVSTRTLEEPTVS